MLSPWLTLAGVITAALPFSASAAPAPDPTTAAVTAPSPPAVPRVPESAPVDEPVLRPDQLDVRVLARFPHDTAAFTQGLEWDDGMLYEGTGQYGESELRVVEPSTGDVRKRVALPDTVFGEGITLVGDRVWQLTWMEELAFQRHLSSLDEIDRVSYDGEGWGVCHDAANDRLVMSDGSSELSFRDPRTFDERRTVPVRLDGVPLTRLNELECVGDDVWANVWTTDEIVRIDPATGTVEAVVDASGLLSDAEADRADVLNGIAAIPGTDLFVLTGKYWPWTFVVQFA